MSLLGMVFQLMEPAYSPFNTGVPTASASYLGYAAYGPGLKECLVLRGTRSVTPGKKPMMTPLEFV